MNRFEELRNALEVYKDKADKIIMAYVSKETEAKARYNDATYQQEHVNYVQSHRQSLAQERSKAESRTSGILDDITNDLKKWVAAPVEPVFLSTLTAIKTAGIKLNRTEVQALREKAGGNFIAEKFIAAISKDSGIVVRAASTEEWFETIQAVKNGVSTFLMGYCGERLEGKELLGPHYYNGVKYSDNIPIHIISNAQKILNPDSALTKAANIWGDGIVPIIDASAELSKEDKAYLDSLYRGHEGDISRRTREILSINPELEDKLLLSEYAAHCPHFGQNQKE